MRELKFRIWDSRYKEMVPPEGESFTLSNFAMGLYPTGLCNESSFRDDLVLMQYTGLKDKNGKEIYEGDILKNVNDFGTFFMPISFEDGMFTTSSDSPSMPISMSNTYMEVIGNIYENPDFLDQD